ncbi:hypothetical protein JTB14_014906 [Gonioctena quinquepunctata]|nr:hypothetical protein JTB14_014906 [Gonioctena quinquepunctata]
MKKSERSKVSSKRVEIERRRLALETEVARAELMMKKQELENQIRILDLQKGLAEAEIEEGELCSVQSKSSRKLYNKSLGESSRNEVVQEWMNKCEMHSDHPPREKLEKEINEKVVLIDKTLHENDLSKLCNVIADAVKSVSGRNQFDRDLSIFDGKPEDWPLLISQFHRKTRMYQYSEDEVMLKLQKCLKGEALEAMPVKSILEVTEASDNTFAANIPILTSDNAEGIINTSNRFEDQVGNPFFDESIESSDINNTIDQFSRSVDLKEHKTSFISDLRQCFLEENIGHSAATRILKILSKHDIDNNLPIDIRTLLGTPRNDHLVIFQLALTEIKPSQNLRKTERDDKMDVFQEQERFRKETVEQRELWAQEMVKLWTELENINEIVKVNEKEAEENLKVRLEEEKMMMLNEADSDREAYQRLLNDHHILEQYNGELKNLLNAQGSQGLHRRNNKMPEHHGYGSVRSTISNSSARKKLENIDWRAGRFWRCVREVSLPLPNDLLAAISGALRRVKNRRSLARRKGLPD